MSLNKVMFSSKRQDWSTPLDFFKKLDDEFHFTLDPCAEPHTAKAKKYYTKKDDGLRQVWENEIVYVNPPFGKYQKDWIKKCYMESKHAKVVALIPARTDTIAFHKYILGKAEIRFIKGRLKFGGSNNSSPFPSMVVIWNKSGLEEMKK